MPVKEDEMRTTGASELIRHATTMETDPDAEDEAGEGGVGPAPLLVAESTVDPLTATNSVKTTRSESDGTCLLLTRCDVDVSVYAVESVDAALAGQRTMSCLADNEMPSTFGFDRNRARYGSSFNDIPPSAPQSADAKPSPAAETIAASESATSFFEF